MKRTKHDIVKSTIIEWISSGALSSGERVPTENELTRRFSVSRSPVRQALLELAAEGYIYTLQGSGSYVRARATKLPIHALLYATAHVERRIVMGMHAAVRDRRDSRIRLSFHYPGATTEKLIDQLAGLRTDEPGALVIVPVVDSDSGRNRRLATALRSLQADGWQIVQLDHTVPELKAPVVSTDHRIAAADLARYTVSSGHASLAVVYDHPERSSIADRLSGISDVLAPVAELRCPADAPQDRWNQTIDQCHSAGATGVIALESELADRLLEYESGIAAGLAVYSFDESRNHRRRVLAHVAQPLHRLGEEAVFLALRLLESDGSAGQGNTLLRARIVSGSTSGITGI